MTTRNRAGVKRRLVEFAEHAVADLTDVRGRPVTVRYTWPGDDTTDTALYLGTTDGDLTPETISTIKGVSRDDFTIQVYIETHGHADGLDAEAEAEAILVAFEEVLLASSRLRHPDIDDGDTASYHGIASAYIGPVEGPFHSFPQGDLVIGRIIADVVCRTDLY